MIFIRSMFLISVINILFGCSSSHDYNYLVQHPAVLSTELARCRAQITDALPRCQVILNAAQYVGDIENDMQRDPQRFGEKILLLQTHLADLHTKIGALEQKLQSTSSSLHEQQRKDVTVQLTDAKKAYVEQRLELKVMLAIVGLNTPG